MNHVETSLCEQLQTASDNLQKLKSNMAQVLRGQDQAIEMTILCFLANGHLLIEDVPGVGKTTLACAFAQSLDLPSRRIQFTSDILPTDILGVNIYDPKRSEFTFHEGPIFTNILLADEINRAEPRAQSALLEAMFERQVTIDGITRVLPNPFMVIATQNPVDFSGTFPLPDSQLDRFQFRISMGYPTPDAEKELLKNARQTKKVEPVLNAQQISDIIRFVDNIRVSDEIIEDLLAIIHATRCDARILQGASTRAMLDLRRAACARAILNNRAFVIPDDLIELAVPTLAHRIRLAPRSNADEAEIIQEHAQKVAV